MSTPSYQNVQLDHQTIADFSEQWTTFTDNTGYYGSTELLADIFGPLLSLSALRGWRVGDIGSGTGRIVNMLLDAGADHVVAVEPSDAFDVLRQNTAARASQVSLIRGTGEAIPAGANLDLVVSIGVVLCITNPAPVIAAARAALRPGGRLLVWVYGREGNRIYLTFCQPLRALTTRLPHRALNGLCSALNVLADVYIGLCAVIPLPLHRYVRNVFGRLSREKRHLVIYDQLNPSYAKYYTEEEARRLLEDGGFRDVRLHHRHGYSWTVIGEKPGP
jgi:SAM-dependent methyltransferase